MPDPTPTDRRSPLEHERDAGLDTSHEALDRLAIFRALSAALEAALEAERGWKTVALSNQQMAQHWQARAETAEAALAEMTAEATRMTEGGG
jgi:hypothetical protein